MLIDLFVGELRKVDVSPAKLSEVSDRLKNFKDIPSVRSDLVAVLVKGTETAHVLLRVYTAPVVTVDKVSSFTADGVELAVNVVVPLVWTVVVGDSH